MCNKVSLYFYKLLVLYYCHDHYTVYIYIYVYLFSHLADAFIQSDFQIRKSN